MPFIDAKIAGPVAPEQKEELKSAFGEAIALLGKPEAYTMIGIREDYDLYFGGRRLEKGAYVSIAMLGEPDRKRDAAMTARVTEILQDQLAIPPENVYVSFQGIRDWGWQGSLF